MGPKMESSLDIDVRDPTPPGVNCERYCIVSRTYITLMHIQHLGSFTCIFFRPHPPFSFQLSVYTNPNTTDRDSVSGYVSRISDFVCDNHLM